MVWSILGGIIIAVIGIFVFLKPDLVWALTEKWTTYRANEPSDFYLNSTKLGGALFVLLGIAMVVLPLVLE